MLKPAILGIIQGATEFLPVSSTAHLILMRWFFGWNGELSTLSFDVALHAGTLTSLLICFSKDIANIIKENKRLALFIAIGTLPAGLAGFLGEDFVSESLRSPFIVASALIVFGLVMLASERFQKLRDMQTLTLSEVLFIGIAQAIALVPGVSRSGITISAALMMGLKRQDSARFSFLLSIPIVAGASVLEGSRLMSHPEDYDLGVFVSGFLASSIAGIFAIKFLLGYLRRHPLNVFVYYRIALAVIIMWWGFTGSGYGK